MIRKLISLNLALLLLVMVTPLSASAALASEESRAGNYKIMIDGRTYDATEDHSGANWSYAYYGGNYGVLELSNYDGGAIKSDIDLDITYQGENRIEAEFDYGIYGKEWIWIYNDDSNGSQGNLEVYGSEGYAAICAKGSLYIRAPITAKGGGTAALLAEQVSIGGWWPCVMKTGDDESSAREAEEYDGEIYVATIPQTYVIILNGNGGRMDNGSTRQVVLHEAGEPGLVMMYPYNDLFWKAGSRLIGWRDEQGNLVQLDAEYAFEDDTYVVQLEAVWEDDTYKALTLENYYGDYGSYDGSPDEYGYYWGESKLVAVETEEPYMLPELTRTGCVFDGWEDEYGEILPGGTEILLWDSTTFTARFTELLMEIDGAKYSAAYDHYAADDSWSYEVYTREAELCLYENYSGEPVQVPGPVSVYVGHSVFGNAGEPAIFVDGDGEIYVSYNSQGEYPLILAGGAGAPAVEATGRMAFAVWDEEQMLVLQSGGKTVPAIQADKVKINEKVFRAGTDEDHLELVGTYSGEPYAEIVDAWTYTVELQGMAEVPDVPWNEDYALLAWEDVEGGLYMPGDIVDAGNGLILEAWYTERYLTQCAILIGGNGGTTEQGRSWVGMIASYGDLCVYPENEFERPGYEFAGYGKKETGGEIVMPGDPWSMDEDCVIERLYAQWKKISGDCAVSGTVSGGEGTSVALLMDGEIVDAGVTDEEGCFALTAEEGTFDLVIRKPGCLTYTITGITAADGDVDLGTILPLAGDVNGDDMINIMDMGIFRQNFGKSGGSITNAHTDTNGDKMVNIIDMSTFRTNFGKTAVKDCTVVYNP